MTTEMSISDTRHLPRPQGYKLLVAIPSPKEKSDGGIIIPDMLKDAEKTASIYGNVVLVGPDAYADEGKFPSGPYCQEGDWVIFKSYSGTRFRINGEEFRLINDDTVEAVVDDPRTVTRA
jgi:co-chaperonin GroES (HSP10)